MEHTQRTHSRLAILLLTATLPLLTACAGIHAGEARPLPQLSRPVLGDVTLIGLEVDDIQYAGSSTSVSSGYGHSTSNTPIGAYNLQTTEITNTSNVHTTTHMARVKSDEIRTELRYALEDNRVVRRFVPDGRLRIEGRRVSGGATTGIGKMAWNTLNALSLLSILPGLPFLGDAEAEVELRVYYDDALIRSYRGRGDASWRKNAWGIAVVLNQYRVRTVNAATRVAVRNAVLDLIDNPPALPAGDL